MLYQVFFIQIDHSSTTDLQSIICTYFCQPSIFKPFFPRIRDHLMRAFYIWEFPNIKVFFVLVNPPSLAIHSLSHSGSVAYGVDF